MRRSIHDSRFQVRHAQHDSHDPWAAPLLHHALITHRSYGAPRRTPAHTPDSASVFCLEPVARAPCPLPRPPHTECAAAPPLCNASTRASTRIWHTCPHKPRAQHNFTTQVATVARSRHQMKHSSVRPASRARAVVALAALTSPPLMLDVGHPLRRGTRAGGSAGASSLTRA